MPHPQIFIDLAIPKQCIDRRTAAEENKRSFVIHRQKGDEVWRTKVDGCWLDSQAGKKVDYLFWCKNSKIRLCLVELKGKDFGTALKQIEHTLQHLYRIKPELRQFAAEGGICAYVILSSGQGASKRFNQIANIKKRYKVIVRYKTNRLPLQGVNQLC